MLLMETFQFHLSNTFQMFHKCVCWLQCSKIDPDLEMLLRCSHSFLGTLAPSVTTAGTCPTFYLIPVTTELSDAVIHGRYPATRTLVLQCVTSARSVSTGMEDMEYRKLALRHFLAFKELAKSHWVKILEGVK